MNNAEMKLEIFKEEQFLNVECNFYKDDNNGIYMTREQIGSALQYANPQKAIDNLHNRNIDRLSKFSVTLKLRGSDGKQYNTILYMERGIYEICRFSKQPVANDFYDWVYEKMETFRRTSGVIQLGEEKQFLDNYFPTLAEETKLMMVKDLNKSIKEQQEKINELQPLADDWKGYMDADGSVAMSEVAKILNIKGVGRNILFKILRDNKVLRYNNEPYQSYMNSGYFKVVNMVKNGYPCSQTRVTGKGKSFIRRQLKALGYEY